jgi:response regulator RpfG family c-di-GMP phosphodiesterase
MPNMDGLELSAKILEQDNNVKVCFVSAVEINTKAINELYPSLSIGCFIKKLISIDYFVRRVKAELE